MESKTIKLRFREDTAENWRLANPILDSSEPAREIDTGKIKYGDGITRYNDLPYFVSETITDAPSDDKIYGRKNKDWVEINTSTPSQCECGDLKAIDSTQIDSIIQEDTGYNLTGLFKYNTTINDNIKTASNRVKLPLSADKGITSISEDNLIKYRLNEETVNAINTSEMNSISINIRQLKEILLNSFTRILSIYMTVKNPISCNNHTLILRVQEDKTLQASEVDGGSSNVMQVNDKIFLNCVNSDNNIYRLSGVDKYGDRFNLKFNESGEGLILRIESKNTYETQENNLNTYTTTYYIDKELTDADVSFNCILKQEKITLNYYEEPVIKEWIEGTSVWNLPLDTFTDETSIRHYFDNTTIPDTTIQYQVPNPEESSEVEGMVLGVSLQKQISDTQNQYGVMILFDGTVSFEYIRNIFEQQWNVSPESGSHSNYVYVKGNIGYIEFTTTQQQPQTKVYNFYIDNLQYTAEARDGAETEIWANWLNSERNSISLADMNGEVYDSTKTKVLQSNGKNVKSSDPILEGGRYILKNTSEGPGREVLESGTSQFNFPVNTWDTSDKVRAYFSEDLIRQYNVNFAPESSLTNVKNSTLMFRGSTVERNYMCQCIVYNDNNTFEESKQFFDTIKNQQTQQGLDLNYYYVDKNIMYVEAPNIQSSLTPLSNVPYNFISYNAENEGIYKINPENGEKTRVYDKGFNWSGTPLDQASETGENTTLYVLFHNGGHEMLLYNVNTQVFSNIKGRYVYNRFSIPPHPENEDAEMSCYTEDELHNMVIKLSTAAYKEYPVIKVMNNQGDFKRFYKYNSFVELTKEQTLSSDNTTYFFNLTIDGQNYVGSKSEQYNDSQQKQTITWVLLNSNNERVLINSEYIPGTYTLEQYGDIVIG